MARKKKSRKSKKSEATPSATPVRDGGEPEPEREPPKPKKKRARKKAEKKQAEKEQGGKKKGGRKRKGTAVPTPAAPAQTAPPPTPEPAAPAEAEVDLDADEIVDAEARVAEVAVLDEVAAGERAAIPVEVAEEPAIPVEDIDAVLDDDETPDLASLIAQTVAGAEPEDRPADEHVESLDDELTAVPAADTPRPVETAPVAEPGPPVASVPALAGGEEEPEEEIDLTGAIDLGPEITQELRDRLLAQALAHAELQDARYRVPYADPRPAGRWKALVAAGLILVAGVLAAAPPEWVRPDPPAQLDAESRARALRTALLLQSQQVDAYRVRHQELPESLEDLAQRVPGLRYVRSGGRAYQIIGYEQDGNAIIYDSSSPSPEFGRLARGFEPGDAP